LLKHEFDVLTSLNHENIVKVYGYCPKDKLQKYKGSTYEVAYIVLELVIGHNLAGFLNSKKFLEEKEFKYIFFKIINVIKYMHCKGIAHRDIKIENIMIDSNKQIKMIDFGFADKISGNESLGLLEGALGTKQYAAPEILLGCPYNGMMADIFAVGVTLFIIAVKAYPFEQCASTTDNKYNYFWSNQIDKFWEDHMRENENVKRISFEVRELISLMLSPDHTQRPSISEIYSHKWLSDLLKLKKDINIFKY